MGRLFGTDGVRGIANRMLTCEMALSLGMAATRVLTHGCTRPRILIGRDTRISCDMLEAALSAGVTSVGGSVELLGVLPTPALAYLTEHYQMDAGVMISASHNSMEYNGIKWVDGNGYKLPDAVEDRIEAMMQAPIPLEERPCGEDIGRVVRRPDPAKEYVEHILSTTDVRFDGMKVVLDCAQGAASFVAQRIFEALGAQVLCYYNQPDGTNINAGCGSTHPKSLQSLVVQHGAAVGLAFDGDADRLICVDENGALVDGDQVMAICAIDMKQRGRLNSEVLVATVMSNLGLEIALRDRGIRLEKTDVGDRYVLAHMLQNGYNLGGEQSGHIIFSDYAKTGDGILTAVQLLSIMVRSGKELSELADVVEILPQVLVNAKVCEEKKHNYAQDGAVQAEILRIEKKYAGNGRVLIRTSGTEALVRVMIEGQDEGDIAKEATCLARMIEERFQ